ncbi:MAG TPA: IPT/TIG domain-containing protein [Candidatus Angelobacter sp.]
MKHAVSHKQIEQRTLRTEATRANLFRIFRPPAFVAALFIFIAMVASQGNAQTDGIMVLQNMTTPRGGVWLANSTPATPPGGHFWQTDGVLGICRVDPLPGGNPPWQLTNCQATAKTASEPVVATPAATIRGLPAGAQFIFVADASSKTVNVVRYVFDPSTERLSANLTIQVQNATSVGGGAGGGRPVGLALGPNGTDLYVGYLKSGDIMKVPNATSITSGTPPVTKIGTTSDGRGVNSILFLANNLYLAEIGGAGLSVIPDPQGISRVACNSASPCRATTVTPTFSFFPGGLATDGTNLFVGDSPLTTPGSILKWNPSTGALSTYSVNVPAYVSNYDNQTRNQYVNPFSLGFLPNGDLMVGDDFSASLVVPTPPTQQGHVWRVAAAPTPPTITSIAPNNGPTAGGTALTVTGSGFDTAPGATQIFVGANQAITPSCASVTTCTATTPAGSGIVDVRVVVNGEQSATSAADLFTYNAPPPPGGGPTITSISPTSGLLGGGTSVTITGTNLAGATSINFGPNAGTAINCAADGSSCTVFSPAGTGTVDVQVTTAAGTSAVVAGDRFTYGSPTASLYAWGITAPKGGMVFLPGSLGGGPGHFWASDHVNGFCREDLVPGTTLHAINYAVCDDGSIGSPGQAVYDPRVNADGVTHYVYVPDNAVKSVAVWRLTYNPTTETIVGPPEGMIPLADVRTLKPNGMALGPDGNLYVTDLTEANIRQITNPNGDPRTQTVGIVAVTGDGRGANGTIGFIGNNLYISENRAASFINITACPPNAAPPCATTPLPMPSGVFIAGVATDPVNGFVYAADSPGGANANIWRYSLASNTTTLYLQGGVVPAAGSPNATVWCALTCTRPFDPNLTPGGTAGFSFAFGLYVDTTNGSLYVTEDPTAGNRGGRGRAWVAPLVP